MSDVKKINVVEIGPRDGFQNVPEFIPTETKIQVVKGLIEAGVKKIQLTSFVSPKAIPQMRDAGELCEVFLGNYPGVEFFALVPNAYGADAAVKCGLKELTYVISVSEAHNMANVRRSVDDSFAELAALREKYPDLVMNLDAATTFGCPFDGDVPFDKVDAYVKRAVEIGVDTINLCDTIGLAVPSLVESVIGGLLQKYPDTEFHTHIHDTRNMGMLNSYTAIQLGIRNIQTTIGGLGGCPFAPGASGNTATEDFVYMLNRMGYDTGIDFRKLLDVALLLKDSVNGAYSGHQMHVKQKVV